ncbi:MAG: hypothetical protein UR80_C0008G0002 [Parcubacteria group bacterium GW2011_GWB1_35_5]|nr:MAG: hypothetical protein UR80_C0008G0002 [Parcubacteria group bacterium GW2011_GWB1_35_5]
MPIAKKETKPIKKAEKKEKISKAKKTKIPAEKGGFAVIEAGGKQYRVFVGDVIKIEIIKGEHKEGDQIVFDKVLLIDNGKDVTDIGTPYIEGAKVVGTLSEKNGHRQPYFKIKIDKIS